MNKELQNLLLSHDTFVVEGELNKNKVSELARNYDKELLELLQSVQSVKKHFFTETDGGLVFKLEVFLQFLNNKAFLPDSFTVYKQKIGLAIDGGIELLSQNKQVVLNWPYKDCVLEGGQTKEDAKRDELFFNQILSPTEINRLLEAKSLENFKKYDQSGDHDIKKIEDEDNLIIKGNNLVALHSLKKRLDEKGQKVKLIYIDPPYLFNKKNEGDSFVYNSTFQKSTWFTFMRNRLEVAKSLLAEGGTIWISISEDGMHYLKVLADSIFGADKFLGTTPRRTRDAKNDVPFNYSQDFDWLLAYTNVSDTNKVIGRKVERKYYESDDFPGKPWRLADLTTQKNSDERPNSYFTMVDPKTGKEYPASKKRTWAVTTDTFQKYYDTGYIVFPNDYDFLNISKPYARKFKEDDDKTGKLSAVISDFAMKDFLENVLGKSKNKQGADELQALGFANKFSYPKPENLLKSIIEVTTEEGDLVLDFFMGSATTQAAAMKMNRRFIGIEQMDYINSVSVPRLEKVIKGEQGGISVDVDWQGGGSFVYCEIKNDAQDFVNRIDKATDSDQLKELFDFAKKSSFISYRIDPKKLKASEFEKLSLAEQKQFLREIIDNNNLYVNYSDIDDASYGISEEDKELNRQFYGDGE
ncbi:MULTISPECIES: DNA methyltransferase [Bacillus cereus group]|uniref:DNA methyltransferase n=1 Tax=Bacillus cereus group TaxID=86661 RepID=UPI0005CEA50A|nr:MULTISPECIES: site-specific DNA-methyltransferase [Bacillus cereus group]PGY97464.1 hypothetical protein COE05_01065 [Bacillus cereus]QQU29666.1 site-specific DNA-methyltransferase [Bacillus cereus]